MMKNEALSATYVIVRSCKPERLMVYKFIRPTGTRARLLGSRGVKKVCAVERRRFSVGETPTRQRVAPAGSNQSDGGGNEFVEAFDVTNRLGRFSEHVGRNASER